MTYRDVFQEATDRHRKMFDPEYQKMLRRREIVDTILSILIIPIGLFMLMFEKKAEPVAPRKKVHVCRSHPVQRRK